ncbi:MAG: aminopeptidase [Tannerellaceae bacterium]|nr:aminopeptidase [Tannerellaceae bacterium]
MNNRYDEKSVSFDIYSLLVPVFSIIPVIGQECLKEKLILFPQIKSLDSLESPYYREKYVIFIEQPIDHLNPDKGTFTQRVILNHVDFHQPTVIVTEGYGGGYALQSGYYEELSRLLNTNVVFVEHRYFLESTPEPCDWQFLTAENAVNDLHTVTTLLKNIYVGKWISTGISKGGQNTLIYRSYFPDDVDISVSYVGPLNRAVEDERHLSFLRNTGSRSERKKIKNFQQEILKRKAEMVPLLSSFSKEKNLTFRIPLEEVLDYCVLEYPFALWQWGTSVSTIPSLQSSTEVLFNHLVEISGPDYFSEQQPYASFFVQAARELGYYPYDTKPLLKWLSITSADNYLTNLMLPEGVTDIDFSDSLYRKLYSFLKNNDPKMIFIYGENDPWSATRIPDFKNKKNLQTYIEPKGCHLARIGTMPEAIKKIITQLHEWLAE